MKYKLNTEQGNIVKDVLLRKGWIVISEYDKHAYDKGVDYDEYILFNWFKIVTLKWTNWFEWEISGSQSVLDIIIDKIINISAQQGDAPETGSSE